MGLQRRLANKERRKGYKYFNGLLLAQNHLCHFCKAPLFRDKKRPKAKTINKTHYEITLVLRDIEVTRSIATIEHLLPLRKGGRSNQENLVVACRRCNERRNNDFETSE